MAADPSSRIGVSVASGPTDSFRLPNAPHLERFAALQRGALAEAVRVSRERTAAIDAQGFGLNRQYASVLEARIAWWRQAMTAPAGRYARSTTFAASQHVEPDWSAIQRDLSGLAGRLAASLYLAFDEHLGQQALAARERWPHKTGLSRALLAVEIAPGSAGNELMRGSLLAGAGYSGFIQEAGYKVQSTTYTDKQGQTKTRKRHVYGEGRRMPAWKAQYLVKSADGKWRFDADKYDAAAASPDAEEWWIAGYKPAKGKPYRDLILTPAPATAAAVGRDAVAGAVKE